MLDAEEYVVSGDVFFLVNGETFVAWDYKHHLQFALSASCVRALVDPEFRRHSPNVTRELARCGILVPSLHGIESTWGWDILSRIFHLGTSRDRPPSTRKSASEASWEYVTHCASIIKKIPSDAFSTDRGIGDVSLDIRANNKPNALLDVLASRSSNRRFSGDPIAFSDASIVLDETLRYREHNDDAYEAAGMFTPTMRRSSPSGGSLQSCEGYLIARKVSGLSPGIYHYRSHRRNIGLVAPLPQDFNFGTLLGGQMFAEDLSAAIVLSCRFDKLMWKYRQSRSYRVALLDAGHLSQTAQLVATSLGLRTWLTAAFFDEEMSNLLTLDKNSNEFPLLVIGLGAGEPNPIDRDLDTTVD